MTPTELLDHLDALHAAATPGEWEHIIDDHGRKGIEHSVWSDRWSNGLGGYVIEELDGPDAALIVAAVNHQPQLVAALRNAANVLTKHYRTATGLSYGSPDECSCGAKTQPLDGPEDVSVRRARAFAEHQAEMLTSALSPAVVSD